MSRVGVVVVSHSRSLADGVVELAGQMAPDVPLHAAGGTDEGAVGTSLDRVLTALQGADRGTGAVVLYDLGSAEMTAEMAVETLDEVRRGRVRVVDAPLVEGALAAATASGGGASLEEVAAAATAAYRAPVTATPAELPDQREGPVREVMLINPLGLHARTAAQVARLAAGMGRPVTVSRADGGGAPAPAASVLALVALGAAGGIGLRVRGEGPESRQAVDAVADLLASGFDET
jgi:dihydroxyacetone kinase phosphotransfer subunit